MNRLTLWALGALATLGTQAQTLRNPVIAGFHPDPSVCRVDSDFYLVNSSFQYFPGVPLYHSRDLVNWELVGNVLTRDSQLPLRGASSWLGIYAPTIRYHEGTYYMITTNVGNGGNFLVTATDPRGPWSEPVWLQQQGIDPSLWFEDGRCYMVSNPDNTIMLCEIDPATGQQLTDSRPLWRGTGGRYPEGPHLYKKDGYYYLLISEGGTELAHRLTVARSRHIEGPYEPNPQNPLLTNCSMAGQGMQIQGTGHGDLVQAADGTWWLVLLAYRNFGGSYHHLGRETCLVPVEWPEGGWPVVNGGQPVDTLMQVRTLPAVPVARPLARTLFNSTPLGPEWVYIQNPVAGNYRQEGGRLWLTANQQGLTANEQPTFVGRRQESAAFCMETSVAVAEGRGGLTVYQIHDGHADLFVDGAGQVAARLRIKSVEHELFRADLAPLAAGQTVGLRVESDGQRYYFSYRQPGSDVFTQAGSVECMLLSTEVVGGFTGVVVGMYADTGRLAFDAFEYTEK